ncbi:thiol reductant ABC exporter subunit CydD [Acetobacter senegalensis]|uniref:thiol reductant ABC exporter subunit CydD n=1 Tax=Acetobacter senegalensis TaxID=446692 RepID=UPI00209CEFD3|nr:thiol reductant ABC exporter subunit CydD [Acetobacter senegalensis]MCP1194378.1 thiol reductant ABC exporter subunit CydD [Acetobacter senegalensis]
MRTQQHTDWQTAGLARRATRWLVTAVILGGASCVLFVLQLTTLAHAVDDLTFKGHPLANTYPALVQVGALCAGSLLLQWLADMAGTEAGLRISASVQRDMLRHLFRAGPVGCAALPAGQIVTTMTEGTAALQPYFAQYIPRAAMMVVLPGLILAMVFHLDGWSFAILACTGPLIPVFMALIGYSAQAIMNRQWVQLVIMGSSFLDSLRGLGTLRLFGQTQASITRMREMAEAHRRATFSVMKVAFLTSAALEFFASLSIALVAVVFGVRLLNGTADFRSAFLVLLLAPEYFMPLRAFSASYHARQNATAAAARIAEIFAVPELEANSQQPRNASGAHGAITALECQHVSAAYATATATATALDDVCCKFSRNQLTVLTGESGAGKTTLLRVLLGFLPVQSGHITALDRHEHPLAPSQGCAGWLPQRPLMIFGTVADNLRLANPDADMHSLRAAARQADALGFIEALPNGFETMVGERGTLLSGGQIKRLALARVLLRDPDVLCLDEPTANLDPGSAHRIAQTIRRCAANRIVIVATHDPALVRQADQILHIENARVENIVFPKDAAA